MIDTINLLKLNMKPTQLIRSPAQTLAMFVALLSLTSAALAQSSDWTNTNGGSWASSSNWSNNIIASGAGNTADFSELTLMSNTTVTLDSSPTIGNLLFGDMGSNYTWEIDPGSGGSLTLDAGGGSPTITVNNETTTISAALAGANGFTKTGVGALMLTGANTYTGTTVANGGVLVLGPGGTLTSADHSGIIIDNGATVQFSGDDDSDTIGTGSMSITVNAGGVLGVTNENSMGYDDLDNYANITLNGGAFSLSAVQYIGTITLNGGTVSGESAMQFWYAVPTAITVTSNATISAPVNLNNAFLATISVVPGQTLTVSGALQSDGAIALTGGGTLTLTADNTYTGSTTVSGSTLDGTGTISGPVAIQSGGTLAVSTDVDSNAVVGTMSIANTLTFNSGSTNFMRITKTGGATASDAIAGSGGTVNYGGTLVVSNITSDNTSLAVGDTFNLFLGFVYNGTFNNFVLPPLPGGLTWNISQLASGSISVANTAATPVFTPPAGQYIGAEPLSVTITSLTPGATIYYTTNGTTPTAGSSSGITPVTVLVPVGATMTIQAYAHETGYADSGIASATYSTEVGPAVWIDPAGGSWSLASNWTNNIIPDQIGVTADFSQLTLPGSAFVTLDTASPTGTWTVGDLIFGDTGSNYTWEIDTGSGGTLTLAATNTSTITVLNQTATIGAVIGGTNGFVKAGAGTLALTGADTYTGPTVINGGTLIVGPGGSLTAGQGASLTVNNGATLQFSGNSDSDNIGGDFMPITVNSGGVLAVTVANSMGYDYLDNYANILLNNATFALSADQYIGTITLNGGTVNGTGAMQFWYAVPTAITVTSNATISAPVNLNNDFLAAISVAPGQTLTVSGAVQSDGSILVTGAGTLVLSGADTYTGPTTVSNGTLELDGSLSGSNAMTVDASAVLDGSGTNTGPTTIESGGTLEAGTSLVIATMTIENTLTLNAGSTTIAKLDKAAATNDSFAGMSALTYGGTLTVTNLAGTLAAGDNFPLFDASTFAGNFSATNLPALGSGLAWKWTPTNGTLAVVPTATAPTFTGTPTYHANSFSMSFTGANGQSYTVIMTTNLTLPLSSWAQLTNGVFGSGAVDFTDTNATNTARFYRIMSP